MRDRSVFINCPFDHAYIPLLRAICFTVRAIGYVPRCALDMSDSGDVRFTKILDMLSACDRSIHDLSRVEPHPVTNLPRFNMPLELGADLALRIKGPLRQRRRRTLIIDAEPHRYDATISDISGQDIEAHGNSPTRVIEVVRDWLNANRGDGPPLPGGAALALDYETCLVLMPDIAHELRLDIHRLSHRDFLDLVDLALPMIEAARPAIS